MSSIFNITNGLAKGLGSAASGAADAAGKLLSGAGDKFNAALNDTCPGTSFQLGNYRTNDGKSYDPNGKFKVCQEKRLFGKNDPPFYVDGSQKKMIDKNYWSKFGYSGLKNKKSSRSRKHKKMISKPKHKKASKEHKKASKEHKKASKEHKKSSKKRSMKHKSW